MYAMHRVPCRAADSAQRGRRELKKSMWMYFIQKLKYFYVTQFKLCSQTLTLLRRRGYFPHFLLGISLAVAASRTPEVLTSSR